MQPPPHFSHAACTAAFPAALAAFFRFSVVFHAPFTPAMSTNDIEPEVWLTFRISRAELRPASSRPSYAGGCTSHAPHECGAGGRVGFASSSLAAARFCGDGAAKTDSRCALSGLWYGSRAAAPGTLAAATSSARSLYSRPVGMAERSKPPWVTPQIRHAPTTTSARVQVTPARVCVRPKIRMASARLIARRVGLAARDSIRLVIRLVIRPRPK